MKIQKLIVGERPKGKIYFCSDLHYGHANAIKHADRPFKDVTEMNEYILKTLKETLTPDDVLFDLGDLFWKCDYEDIKRFVECIPCKFYHIQGNHDNENIWKYDPLYSLTEKVGDIFGVNIKDEEGTFKVILSHFPIESWANRGHGSIHLHGHEHGNYDEKNDELQFPRLDVGFDSRISKESGTFLIDWKTIKEKLYESEKLDIVSD